MNLRAAMDSQYELSSGKWRISVCLQAALVVGSSLSAAFLHDATAVFVVSFLVMGAGWLSYSSLNAARRYFQRASKIRVMFLIQDSLGQAPEHVVQLDLRTDIPEISTELTDDDRNYYASRLPPGANRLAENLRESAHHTSRLAQETGFWFGIVVWTGMVLIFGSLWLAVALMPKLELNAQQAVLLGLAHAIPLGLSFVVTGVFDRARRQFANLAEIARNTVEFSDRLANSEEPGLHEVIAVLSQYNSAITSASPIPRFVRNKWRDRLNDSYGSTFLAGSTNSANDPKAS